MIDIPIGQDRANKDLLSRATVSPISYTGKTRITNILHNNSSEDPIFNMDHDHIPTPACGTDANSCVWNRY